MRVQKRMYLFCVIATLMSLAGGMCPAEPSHSGYTAEEAAQAVQDAQPVTFAPTRTGMHMGRRVPCPQCPGGGRPVFIYPNVPYAQPPTDERRFQPPRPLSEDAEHSMGEIDNSGRVCVQSRDRLRQAAAYTTLPDPVTVSEDCLLLNVYAPVPTPLETTPEGDPIPRPHKPVYVFFHAGGFNSGGALINNGTVLASSQDVVVVTVNYRLDVLGAVSIDPNEKARADSLGFLDQTEALVWVKANIAYFGGDGDRITIGGDGAGAVSVTRHLASAKSRLLFNRVVLHNNYAGIPAHLTTLTQLVDDYTDSLKCGAQSDSECLRTAPMAALMKAITAHNQDAWMFQQDDQVVPLTLKDLMDNFDTAHKVEVLCGASSGAGFGRAREAWPDHVLTSKAVNKKTGERLLGENLQRFWNGKPLELITQSGWRDYFWHVGDATTIDHKRGLTDLIGDLYYYATLAELADRLVEMKKRVYVYDFRHQIEHMTDTYPKWYDGADRGSDIPFFWGYPFLHPESQGGVVYTEAEKSLSVHALNYLGQFIHNGRPSNTSDKAPWPTYTHPDRDTMNMFPPHPKAGGGGPANREHFLRFWKKKVPLLIKYAYTAPPKDLVID